MPIAALKDVRFPKNYYKMLPKKMIYTFDFLIIIITHNTKTEMGYEMGVIHIDFSSFCITSPGI